MTEPDKTQTYIYQELEELSKLVLAASLPDDLKDKASSMLERLNRMVTQGGYSAEFEAVSRYVHWIVALPWFTASEDNLDLSQARSILDKSHYGMDKVKERILEYLALLHLTQDRASATQASVLCLIGMPGLGKTSIARAIATAMGRQFIRIAMGGLGSATQLRGVPKTVLQAEPGEVIKGLKRARTMNPVILLDEIDRVSEAVRGDVMGVLLELLDPEQNSSFEDYYIDYPFNLSKALFICSANNTGGIANAVLDRLEVIEMPSYTDEEKKRIGKDYLLPKALSEAGLTPAMLQIDEALWALIIRPLGYDAGIRTLDRTIRGIVRKVALLVVEGKGSSFVINEKNIKDFLPTW